MCSAPIIIVANCEAVASAVGTVPALRPPRSTVTRSVWPRISSILCETSTTEWSWSAIWRTTSNSFSHSWGASTAVGSSSIRIRAPRYSCLRISTRCCSPTDSCQMYALGWTLSPYSSAISATRVSTARSVRRTPWPLSPSTRFSATVREGTSRKCWYTMPIPCSAASWGERRLTRWPSRLISPESGRYRPASTEQSVDLPAPFSPSRPWTSPARRSKFTWSLAATP